MRNDDFDDYRSGYLDYEEINRIVAQKMAGCILWMVVGLLVSGITGYLAIYNDAIRTIVAGSYYVLFFVELGLSSSDCATKASRSRITTTPVFLNRCAIFCTNSNVTPLSSQAPMNRK